jgi:hypothetical protein
MIAPQMRIAGLGDRARRIARPLESSLATAPL